MISKTEANINEYEQKSGKTFRLSKLKCSIRNDFFFNFA